MVANRDPTANNPHDRITLTLPGHRPGPAGRSSPSSGASKRDAFAGIVAGDDLPAARVAADEVLWLVDADAVGDTPLPG